MSAPLPVPSGPGPGRGGTFAWLLRVSAGVLLLLLTPLSHLPAAETDEEPWVIEGESLQGARGSGTEITSPRVTHGTLTITSLEGRLSPDQDILSLHGDVHIVDTSRVTDADDGVYRRSARILDLTGNVRGHGPEGSYEAESLTWDRARGRLTLRGSPEVSQPERVLWADRFEYDTVHGTGEAFGHVRVLMLPDSTWAYGEHAAYDEAGGRTILTGSPRMVSPSHEREPAGTVHADTLILEEASRTGLALGAVNILRGGMRARSERSVFHPEQDRIVLFGEPVAWDREGEVRADTMSVHLKGNEADELRAYGRVQVVYEPGDKPGERNVVLGDTLVAGLAGGGIRDMEMKGHAVSLYLPAVQDAARDGTGRNLCHARTIHVYLRHGEADRVDLLDEASGIYLYPNESAREKLNDPAFVDSVLRPVSPETAGGETEGESEDPGPPPVAPAGADTSTAPPPEPPPLGPAVEAFLRVGTLAFADSLHRPFDKLFSERVDYEGDTIRFHVPESRIEILGHGKLAYRGSDLAAHDIDYLAARRLITATGEPKLSDEKSTVVGTKMTYRTDEREGLVYQGRTEFDNGYYYGSEIKKLPTDALLVRSGDYTTCDKDSSSVADYHFHADRMKVILKDKVVARPVILYIRHIPVLALPYWIFPIRKGRHSGIMMPDVQFGLNNTQGRFARNLGYYWAISDYMDSRTWVDYYDQGPQIYFNEIFQYKVRYLLDGSFTGSYQRQKQIDGSKKVRWSLLGGHNQKLGESATATAQVNYTSDQSFRGEQDFAAGVDERLNRILKSSLALSKGWSRSSLNVTAVHTEYLDATTAGGIKVDQQAPSVNFSINPGTIGRAPDAAGRGGRLPFLSSTTFGTSFQYRSVYQRSYSDKVDANQAVGENLSLSDTRKIGPYLRIQPGISGNWAAFQRDNLGRHYRGGYSWSASISAGNTLYGNFLFPFGPLAGLRHVINPSISYSYAPEMRSLTYTTVDTAGVVSTRPRFPSVGGIGLSGFKRSAMSFSVNQNFHAKWRHGEEVIKKENILTWSTSSSYNFLVKRTPGTARARRMTPISNSLQLRPFSNFESTASASHDPYTRAPLGFNVNSNLRLSSTMFARGPADTSQAETGLQYGGKGESGLVESTAGNKPRERTQNPIALPWNLSIQHAYSTRPGGSATNTINTQIDLSPTDKWRVSAGVYVDLVHKEVISNSLSLYRDLHCWEIRFDHRRSGAISEYSFRIAIKQIPDVQYQRQGR